MFKNPLTESQQQSLDNINPKLAQIPNNLLSSIISDFSKVSHLNTIYFQSSTKSIYIPAYLRLVIKNVQSINFQTLQALLKMTILINTYTYGLPIEIREFINQNIQLEFKYEQKIYLKNHTTTQVQDYQLNQSQIQEMMAWPEAKKEIQIKHNSKTNQKKNKQEIQLFQNQQSSSILMNPKHNSPYKSNKIILQPLYTNNESFLLKKQKQMNKSKQKKQKKTIVGKRYTCRLARTARIQPYTFFTPFQLLNLIMSFGLKDLTYLDPQTKVTYTIKFNLMDTTQQGIGSLSKRLNLSYTQFSAYKFATDRMAVQYTRSQSRKTLMQLKKTWYSLSCLDVHIQQFQKQEYEIIYNKSTKYAHFHIPIAKIPTAAITTFFIPLWLLSAITLATFFLETSMSDRLAIIATLTIAFIDLIPNIRQKIPINPHTTLLQILVYSQTVTTIICLVQSFTLKDYDQQQSNQFIRTYHGVEDGLYVSAVIITLMNIFIPVCMYVIYIINLIIGTDFNNNSGKNKKGKYKGSNKGQRNVDKTYEKWTYNKQGNQAFLNIKNIQNLIFINEGQKFNQIFKKIQVLEKIQIIEKDTLQKKNLALISLQ